VSPISPVGNLTNQIPLVLYALRKRASLWQCDRLSVETFKFQADLLIDRSERSHHVSPCASTKES